MEDEDQASPRQRVLAASCRPAWVDALVAVGFGLALGVLSAQVRWSWILGGILLVGALVLAVVLNRRFATRRDEPGSGLADRRSGLVYLAMILGVYLLGMLEFPQGWQPGWMLAYAAVFSVIGYGYLRLVERFTVDRLVRAASPVARSSEQDGIRAAIRGSLYQVAALEQDVMARGLGLSEGELDEHVSDLERAGHLQVHGRGRGRTWLALTVPGRQAVTAAR